MIWICGGSFDKIEVIVDNFGKDCFNLLNVYVDFTNSVYIRRLSV